MINFASNVTKISYQKLAKPLLFMASPEKVHDATLTGARITGNIRLIAIVLQKLWSYKNVALAQTIDGVAYQNPINLAAGWDKDATAINLMSYIGLGAVEVGSITKGSYAGNEGTRLWRLKKSNSILVYYGLKNQGVDIIAPRIQKSSTSIPVGTNIARTNTPDCDDINSIKDYAYSFKKLANIGDYFAVNISCPNTFGGQPFHDKKRLSMLLAELDKIKTNKPVYLKISPDISQKERQDIANMSFMHRVDGFICGNLTKNRKLTSIKDADIAEVGGMSGKIVQQLSDELIADMYKYTKGKKTIIGLGGVFTADDAYKKIKLGASLVQMITGLIYQGPQVVGRINKDLVMLLEKDGYTNISQAIGIDNKLQS